MELRVQWMVSRIRGESLVRSARDFIKRGNNLTRQWQIIYNRLRDTNGGG